MTFHLPRLPASLDPLIAEAKLRTRRRRLLLVSVLILLAAGAAVAAGLTRTPPGRVTGAPTNHPGALTSTGSALSNFEALLHDTFGTKDVCVISKSGLPDFVSKPCGALSLAQMQLYFPKFSRVHGSPYHLVSLRYPPNGGVHPIPVQIAGRFVACDPKATSFLFTNSAQYGFSPACYPFTGSSEH